MAATLATPFTCAVGSQEVLYVVACIAHNDIPGVMGGGGLTYQDNHCTAVIMMVMFVPDLFPLPAMYVVACFLIQFCTFQCAVIYMYLGVCVDWFGPAHSYVHIYDMAACKEQLASFISCTFVSR